jgi:cobalt transporter subunit CbtB
MRTVSNTAVAQPQVSSFVRRLGIAAVAGMLGMVFLYGVGFAQVDAVHNAAHDGRHSFSFPCH